MAAVYSDATLTRQQILLAASRQFPQGDVQHWWHEPSGKGTRTRFSDDRLFLPFAALHYAKVTGDESIWDEVVSFIDSPTLKADEQERYEQPVKSNESATVFDHCLRAIEVSLKFGKHGLPLMGCGDWNDGMNRVGEKGQGESVWVAWFLIKILQDLTSRYKARLSTQQYQRFHDTATALRVAIDEHAWDGDWYIRAFFDDGMAIGSRHSEACKIDSLAQSWSVIVNPDRARSKHAFDEAVHYLVDHELKLVKLFDPPFDRHVPDPGYINAYAPGVRENGGQYTHAAIWLVEAAGLMGEYDLAMQLFDYLNPLLKSETAENASRYKLEPYVMAADVYTNPQHQGRGGWSWYTGAAGWMYRVAIETILGLDIQGNQIRFQPRVPSTWKEYSVEIQLPQIKLSVHLIRKRSGAASQVERTSKFFQAGELIRLDELANGQKLYVQFGGESDG